MRFSHIAYLSLSTSLATAYKLTFYRSEGCRSENLGEWIGGPNQGCSNEMMGVAQSAIVASTGPVDDNFMITFFESEDCNPDTEIVHGEPDEDGSACMTAKNYRSFTVWDLYAE